MLVPDQHGQSFGCGEQRRPVHHRPTRELYSCCLCSCARPGSGMSPGASPRPHPSCPTHRWSAEGSCSCVPSHLRQCSTLDAHPLARFPPGLKSQLFPTPGEGVLVHQCPRVLVQQVTGTVSQFTATAHILNLQIWSPGGGKALEPSI